MLHKGFYHPRRLLYSAELRFTFLAEKKTKTTKCMKFQSPNSRKCLLNCGGVEPGSLMTAEPLHTTRGDGTGRRRRRGGGLMRGRVVREQRIYKPNQSASLRKVTWAGVIKDEDVRAMQRLASERRLRRQRDERRRRAAEAKAAEIRWKTDALISSLRYARSCALCVHLYVCVCLMVLISRIVGWNTRGKWTK